jgi:Dullard-like phosphatase family protein
MKNFNDIQCQNNSKNHTRNNINNIYNNIEIEKIPENNQKQNQTIINSSSCKYITLNNFYQNNKNKSQLNINTNLNEENKIKKINKVELLNRMNNNIPKPPFLTTNILYSKFNKKNFTLILDLDETLIKYQICNTNNTSSQNAQNGKILYRPGLIQFLNKIFPLFDIIIWTVATKDYADKIIDNIEKDKKYFSKRLYREHTTYKNKIYIKDLSNLGRALDKVIIVDDKENNFCLQRSNGILIAPFHGTQWECQNDYILMDLYNILTKIVFDRSKDVRIGINKYKKDILEKITKINKCDSDSENKSKNE